MFNQIVKVILKKLLNTFLPFGLFIISNFTFAEGVRFETKTLSSALIFAEENDKLVFVDLYADWCAPCKVMEKSVFTKLEVGQTFNNSFVNIKQDIEESEGKAIALKYNISEYPTYLFINSEGDLVHKIIGYHTPDRLIQEAQSAIRKARNFIALNIFEKQYAEGERSSSFLLEFIEKKSVSEGLQPELLEEYLKNAPQADLKTEKVLSIVSKHTNSIRSKGFELLVSSLEDFMGMTKAQQDAILNGITQAKLATFQAAVANNDETLFEELMNAVQQTSYSNSAAMAEERQFRYDFAKLTRNFRHFSIIAREEAEIIMEKDEAYFIEEDERQKALFLDQVAQAGHSLESVRVQQRLATMTGASKKAAAFQLNEFAYGFLVMALQKEEFQDPIRWSAYSIKLDESPNHWYTYTKLLQKIGRLKDAKKAKKRTLKLAKKIGMNTRELEISLNDKN